MINDASVVIGGGNWGIKEADVLGYKLINDEYYAREIDFANSTAAGTYTDSTGVVRKSPYNLFTYSEQFDNAAWSKQRSTISANVTTSPTGTLTADKLIETNVNGTHIIFFGVSQPSTLRRDQTFSFYAKAGERNWIATSGDMGTTYFNLATGEVGTVTTSTFWFSGITASMQNVGNGWYRCVLSGFGFFEYNVGIKLATANGTDSYTGDDVSGAFVWGAQLVEGTEALPYFPTTTRLNVPRIDYRNADGSLSTTGRLLLEPQRTNSIRNSSMVGAVAGTPGTIPTNWITATSGLTQTIVGVGTENGLPYIDFRFNGTSSGISIQIQQEGVLSLAATVGQTWTSSVYSKIISAPSPPSTYSLRLREGNSGGSFVADGYFDFVPTSSLQRIVFTRTNTGATTAFIQPSLTFFISNGAAYDFTIRIAAPQLELGAYATTWIPTTTAAVTRNADTASRTGVSSWIGQEQGTLFFDFVNRNYLATEISAQFTISVGVDANNRIRISVASGTLSGVVRIAGADQAAFSIPSPINNAQYKVALAYKQNDFVMYVNGTQIGTDTSGNVPACSRISFDNGGASTFNDQYINQAVLFPTRLDNATLAQMTTL